MPYEHLLDAFTASCVRILGEALVGVYLHGSLAMGCFHPSVSDIDLLVVADAPLTTQQKSALMTHTVALNRQAPAKGIEMSVLLASAVRPFQHPTPFELHFSPAHLSWWQHDPAGYIRDMHGNDPDIAAHVTVLHQYGVPLYGRPINEVFGQVAPADYLDSILSDVSGAADDIAAQPVYLTLNLCRVLCYLRTGCCVSKRDGGLWALENIPEVHHAAVRAALDAYAQETSAAVRIPALRSFAQDMLTLIQMETFI